MSISLPHFSGVGTKVTAKNQYHQAKDHLNKWAEAATKNPPSASNPEPLWSSELEKGVGSKFWNSWGARLALLAYSSKLGLLRNMYAEKVLALENQKIGELKNSKSVGNTKDDYVDLISKLAADEARISSMNPDSSKVVFIGSGPDPLTVKEYAKHASQVIGVDINPDAIEVTQPIADASDGKIKFEVADGINYDYKDATHIGLAVMTPQKEILKRVAETARPGAMITVRGATGLGQAMYSPFCKGDWPDTLEHLATLKLEVGNVFVLRKKPLEGRFLLRKLNSDHALVEEENSKSVIPLSRKPISLSGQRLAAWLTGMKTWMNKVISVGLSNF